MSKRTPGTQAAFKVGESSVGIGARYFQRRLALEPHLRSDHLEKLGLRYFFTAGSNLDIARLVELGPRDFPRVPSFQLDRGRLENLLLRELAASGTTVLDASRVRTIALGGDVHRVSLTTPDGAHDVTARWLVDASGRAGLLRRQLGLDRTSSHAANACWFRVRSRVRADDWPDERAWRSRVPSGLRWPSTNHLMGAGYWV